MSEVYQLTTLPGTDVVLSDTEAVLPAVMTFEEWETGFKGLQYMGKRAKFWLGDYIIAGEEKFGEMYAQALDHTSYSLKTLQNIVYTCKNVDPTIRSVEGCLEFGHNTEVAKLDPDEQIDFLRRALEEEWTVGELREAIKVYKAGPEEQQQESYKPDHKRGMQDIADIVNKQKFNAVPKKEDIQKMILTIQQVQKICKEYGIS